MAWLDRRHRLNIVKPAPTLVVRAQTISHLKEFVMKTALQNTLSVLKQNRWGLLALAGIVGIKVLLAFDALMLALLATGVF
jgi:hypothetical protein